MKKNYMIVLGLLFILVLSGCGNNKVKCSFTDSMQGKSVTVNTTANLKDNKVSSLVFEYIFDDKELADNFCNTFKKYNTPNVSINCSNKKVVINDAKAFNIAETDEDKFLIGKTKEEFIELAKNEEMECK